MARPPEVFVQPLDDSEQQRLVGITRRSGDPVRLRWAMMVQMSSQGRPVSAIVELASLSQRYIRVVMHTFNEKRFVALDPKWSGGRRKKLDGNTRRQIHRIALARPRDVGCPFTSWSLAKLRDHLIDTGVVTSLSSEGLRRILAELGITFQATKS